jgi:hypothetical protein
MRLQVIRGAVAGLEVTRLPQVLATSRSPQVEVFQERPPGCKQVVAERVAAALAEEAVVVEQERVAAVPLPQIAALPYCNATAAATSETTAPQRLLHQELISLRPRCLLRR